MGCIILCCERSPMNCLAETLASPQELPVATPYPSCDSQKCFQTLPDVPWRVKLTPVENYCPRLIKNKNKELKSGRYLQTDSEKSENFNFKKGQYLTHDWKNITVGNTKMNNRNCRQETYSVARKNLLNYKVIKLLQSNYFRWEK